MTSAKGETLSIGDVSVARGQTARGRIQVGVSLDGSPLAMPIQVVHGAQPGPRLWVQAGTHGDEYDGMRALQLVVRELDASQLRGSVLAIMSLNIAAHQVRQRMSLIDGLDVNRVYPGDPTATYTRRLAHRVMDLVQVHADYVMDLHGGGNEFDVVHYSIFHAAPGRAGEESETLAKAAGTSLVWASRDLWLENGLFTRATQAGIPSTIIEVGGEGSLRDAPVQAHVTSIRGIMRHLKMIDGAPPREPSYTMMDGADFVTCANGGFSLKHTALGEVVTEGQPVVSIVDRWGDEIEVVRSPYPRSVVLALREYAAVHPGSNVAILGRIST
ncbi:MAG: succinylglutamate desuccinylase/aspartoacylase family protein [Chloroflexi bacterium]|nr:succinylglutamate desuccinylase/aspartoacylase family protein [Chloroflexota bacterium]